MDDAVDIGGLILQHREAGAFADHFGKLGDVIGHLADDFVVQKPADQPGERQHRRRQRDREVKHDLEFEGLRLHDDRQVPSGAGKWRFFQIL